MSKHSHRIQSLDGVRAIAVSMVLVGHSGMQHWSAGMSRLGVGIFFVMSGFLITSLLLRERRETGRISLANFYLRRCFRIMPAFFVYVAAMLAAAALGWIALTGGDIAHTLTYTVNYFPDRSWYIGHVWSLSVEEQFYLLWPAALIFFGVHRGRWIALGCVVALPIVRTVLWLIVPEARETIGESFETVADSMAIGCLLAYLGPQLDKSVAYQRFLASPLFLVVPVVVLAGNQVRGYVSFHLPIGQTLIICGIALCLDWAMRTRSGKIVGFLNARPVAFVGVLSYSLYLWQQPFLAKHSESWFCQFPQNYLCVFAAGLCSYYIVERPCLRLRDRINGLLVQRRAGRPRVGARASTDPGHSHA